MKYIICLSIFILLHNLLLAQEKLLTPAQIYQNYDPAIVIIQIKDKGKYIGHGSGFFIQSDGYIITSEHVINIDHFKDQKDNITIEVLTQDGRKFIPDIVKKDLKLDLALLKIKGHDFPTVQLGDSDKIKVGEKIIIIGTPIRLEFSHSLTEGVISGLNRKKGRIQTSAIIHGGNSGGPAFNLKGEVIGVATSVAGQQTLERTRVGDKIVDIKKEQELYGLTYMIPINQVKEFKKEILDLPSIEIETIEITNNTWKIKFYSSLVGGLITGLYALQEYNNTETAVSEKNKFEAKMQKARTDSEFERYRSKAFEKFEKAKSHQQNSQIGGILSLGLISWSSWIWYNKPKEHDLTWKFYYESDRVSINLSKLW